MFSCSLPPEKSAITNIVVKSVLFCGSALYCSERERAALVHDLGPFAKDRDDQCKTFLVEKNCLEVQYSAISV